MNKEEKLERIRTLVYSSDRANALLVIEMAKNDAEAKDYLPELLGLAFGTEEEEIRTEARKVIAAIVPEEEAKMNAYFNRTSVVNESMYHHLIKIFPRSMVLKMAYTHFKISGKSIHEFLILDDGSSPFRQEILEANRVQQMVSRRINLKGMFPQEIEHFLQNLESFASGPSIVSIHFLKGDYIPSIVSEINTLETLYITDCTLQHLPKEIFSMAQLKRLHFQRVPLPELPTDWSGLKNMEHLTMDDCGLHLDSFSFLHQMPLLKHASFGNATYANPYILIGKKVMPLAGYSDFFKGFSFPNREMLKVAAAIGRSGLAEADQHYFFDLIRHCKTLDQLPAPSILPLLKMLKIKYKPLEAKATAWLHEVIDDQHGMDNFGTSSTLYISGTTAMTKTEIRSKLKELGIKYSTSFNNEVTHVLIGKNPDGINIAENLGVKLILENQLQKYFSTENPQYIEEAASTGQEQISENLSAFLNSEDSSTVMVGLEMLKSGGVPDNLLEDLLLVQKCHPDSKARGAAKKLLERYAPQEWTGLIKDKTTFANIRQEVKAQDLNKKLEKIGKNYPSMATFLSLLLYRKFKKGLRYILYQYKKPCAIRTEALQAMMEGTHFNFSVGLGFKNWRNVAPNAMTLYPMKSPVPFPVDILEVVDKIESINLHNCKLDKLHISIGKFKDLKSLDCSCNFIKALPKTLHKLKDLEELDLSFNAFTVLPEEITLLPRLKKLDLRHNRQSYQYTPVEVSPAIRAALGDCEILL